MRAREINKQKWNRLGKSIIDSILCSFLSRELKSFIIHENFNDTHYNNDIAIFKMDRPVEFSDDIMPICLEKPEFVEELLKPRE